ncbi:MAG: tRNA lysidine(34) synthetase TilS [Planctomycetota bacterium]
MDAQHSTPGIPSRPESSGGRWADATRPSRKDPFARRVIGAWRSNTGGSAVRDADRGTLVACSGGADSTALAAAFASVNAPIVIAHVRHDLREPSESAADEAQAERLAEWLGRPFARASIRTAAMPGNAEANARRARYRELTRIAEGRGLGAVVTGHHADDQLETLLMRLLRGAGPKGMAGIRAARRLAEGITLVRPMLSVPHADAVDFLSRHGIGWVEDRTNQDVTRLRAALRAEVLPSLRRLQPAASRKANQAAISLAESADAVDAMVSEMPRLTDDPASWSTPVLAQQPAVVIAECLRREAVRIGNPTRRQTPTESEVRVAVRVIRSVPASAWCAPLGAALVRVTAASTAIESPGIG